MNEKITKTLTLEFKNLTELFQAQILFCLPEIKNAKFLPHIDYMLLGVTRLFISYKNKLVVDGFLSVEHRMLIDEMNHQKNYVKNYHAHKLWNGPVGFDNDSLGECDIKVEFTFVQSDKLTNLVMLKNPNDVPSLIGDPEIKILKTIDLKIHEIFCEKITLG